MWKDNLKVGKPDVKPDAAAHTPGVNSGNEPGGIEGTPASTTPVRIRRGVLPPRLRCGNPRASTPSTGTR